MVDRVTLFWIPNGKVMIIDPTDPTAPDGSTKGYTRKTYRGTTVLVARSARTNPRTTRQRSNRSNYKQVLGMWRDDTTPAQKADWLDWAGNSPWTTEYGESTFLDAFPAFASSNMLRLIAGLTPQLAAPTVYGQATMGVPVITIDSSSGDISIDYDPADAWADTDGALIINAFNPTGPGRNSRGPLAASVAVALGNTATPPTNPIVVTNAFMVIPTQNQNVKVQPGNPGGAPGVPIPYPTPIPPPPSGPTWPCAAPPAYVGQMRLTVDQLACGPMSGTGHWSRTSNVSPGCVYTFTSYLGSTPVIRMKQGPPPYWELTGALLPNGLGARNYTSSTGLGFYDQVGPICANPRDQYVNYILVEAI